MAFRLLLLPQLPRLGSQVQPLPHAAVFAYRGLCSTAAVPARQKTAFVAQRKLWREEVRARRLQFIREREQAAQAAQAAQTTEAGSPAAPQKPPLPPPKRREDYLKYRPSESDVKEFEKATTHHRRMMDKLMNELQARQSDFYRKTTEAAAAKRMEKLRQAIREEAAQSHKFLTKEADIDSFLEKSLEHEIPPGGPSITISGFSSRK